MTLPDLIARLEAATKGSRELSDEVLLVCGWKHITTGDPREDEWVSPDGTEHFDYWMDPHWRGAAEPIPRRPDPTRSLDDALALARDKTETMVALNQAFHAVGDEMTYDNRNDPVDLWIVTRAACIAILKARMK